MQVVERARTALRDPDGHPGLEAEDDGTDEVLDHEALAVWHLKGRESGTKARQR